MALILVCGLPGTGKTTVAREVASQLDAELLRTDVIRKETFDTITYTDEQMRATYEEMIQRAKDLLQVDKHVVLDATFRKQEYRDLAEQLVGTTNTDLYVIQVDCDDDIVKERIQKRSGDESDAEFETYKEFKQQADLLQLDHAIIDNSGSLEGTRKQVTALLQQIMGRKSG
jgi:predicted kinase